MGDLKNSISDMKNVQRFLRSLDKIIDNMEVIDGLEKREVDVRNRVQLLENREEEMKRALELSYRELQDKMEHNSNDMAAFKETVQLEKDNIIADYDKKITKQKQGLVLLEDEGAALTSEVKGLEEDKENLQKRVTSLKAVITNTDKLIGSVK